MMQHLQPNTTLQGGKYKIERVLGQGGFGNTYMALNVDFDERVAIKEFFMKGVTERDETTSVVSVSNSDNLPQFEEQLEKFKKEARRLRKLKNEHIVKVHNLFEENGTAYYEMDFIDGESLAEKMKRIGCAIPESEVISILQQILEALKEVHENEIWHLDLKPGNILVDNKGTAYLIDFGASKQIRANGSMTTSTALCYTPGYAPNEQIGQMYDLFGPWTDIYALGATVYNLLTNQKPPRVIDIEEKELDAFSFPNKVSEEIKELVFWMMQPKRKKRPQGVDEIIARISTSSGTITNVSHIIGSCNEETIVASREMINAEDTIIGTGRHNEDNDNPAFVDLGLSVKWATNNLHADQMVAENSFFKGVNINGVREWDEVPLEFGGTNYDTATFEQKNGIRLPSRSEWDELINKCDWKWDIVNGTSGYTVIGVNGKCIFLPNVGGYWSSTICPSDVMMSVYYLYFDKKNIRISNCAYTILHCMRPVLPFNER